MSLSNKKLQIKSFLLNYIPAYAVLLVFFVITVANISAVHQTYTFSLPIQCEDTSSKAKILKAVSMVLKETESCALSSPCVESPLLECQEEITYGRYIIGNFISRDLMLHRVFPTLRPFGVNGYKGNTDFNTGNSSYLLLVYLYSVMLIAALAAMFALWRQRLLLQTFAFPRSDRTRTLLYPALMAFIYAVVIYYLTTILEHIHPKQELQGSDFFLKLLDGPALFLLAVVLAPLVEELLFRGILLRFFVERGRMIIGSVLVSIVFASIHGFFEADITWQLFLTGSYFFVSLIMCWLYIKHKTLWSPIIFHSAYNSIFVLTYLLAK